MAQSPPVATKRILSTSSGTNEGSFTLGDWALFLSIAGIWGASFLFMDIGLEAFEPGLITWMRVGLGAGALALFPATRRPVATADRPRIVALSFLWVAVPFTLFPVAQQWINSALTGMLNGGMPIFAAVFATALLRRMPRRAHLVGLVVGFAGVVAISLPSIGEGGTQALGVGLVVLAVMCYGLAVNIAAPVQQAYGALPVMARMLAWASLWTTPLGLVGLARSSWAWSSFVAVTVAGVVGTGIAFVIMASLVGRVGSTRASFITYLIPVVALALGVRFRGDVVSGLALVGVALVILGAVLASRRER
jgi:drug/metabolite transporter (DMT)-like permease